MPAVRQHRLANLESEKQQWAQRLKEKQKVLPELNAIVIAYIEGEDS